jgi:DNA-binding MarR family transcriptional regulator
MASRPSNGQLMHEFISRLDTTRGGVGLQVMHDSGLTLPQVVVLHTLMRASHPINVIADQLDLSMSATSSLIQRLVEGGLVHRVENPEDRREKAVSLTRAGTVLIEKIAAERSRALARGLDAVPDPLRNELLAVIGRVVDHLRSQPSTP